MRPSSLIVVAVWLIAAAGRTRGECCPRTYMEWTASLCSPFNIHLDMQINNQLVQKPTLDFLTNMRNPRCEAKVCNDGRQHDGWYCGKGKCNVFGCNCDGGCIEGDAVENFRRINNIPNARGFHWYADDPTTWKWTRSKRSNVFRNSRAGSKIIKSAYDGYKEGQLSADTSRRDAGRARNNAVTISPPVTPSLVQRAMDKNKPRWV